MGLFDRFYKDDAQADEASAIANSQSSTPAISAIPAIFGEHLIDQRSKNSGNSKNSSYPPADNEDKAAAIRSVSCPPTTIAACVYEVAICQTVLPDDTDWVPVAPTAFGPEPIKESSRLKDRVCMVCGSAHALFGSGWSWQAPSTARWFCAAHRNEMDIADRHFAGSWSSASQGAQNHRPDWTTEPVPGWPHHLDIFDHGKGRIIRIKLRG